MGGGGPGEGVIVKLGRTIALHAINMSSSLINSKKIYNIYKETIIQLVRIVL